MVKKGRLLGFHLLLWNILFSVNRWICLKIWGMYSHQTGWPVRACSLLCWSSVLLVWSLMWVENTGKKLSQVMNHLFTDPNMAGFSRDSSKPLIHNSCCKQRSHSSSGRGGLCRIPPLHQHFRGWNGGPEILPSQISLWNSDYAHGGHFAAALSETPSVAPVWSPKV